MGHLI